MKRRLAVNMSTGGGGRAPKRGRGGRGSGGWRGGDVNRGGRGAHGDVNARGHGGRGRGGAPGRPVMEEDFPDLVQAFLDNNGAERSQQMAAPVQSERGGRGGRRGANDYGRGQPRGRGRGLSIHQQKRGQEEDESERSSSDESENDRRLQKRLTNRREEKKKEFKGPVFGFKRLYKFLECDPNEVLMSISKDKVDWRLLLESSDLEGEKLLVAIHVIAEKICADIPILTTQQTATLTACCSVPFITKLDQAVPLIAQGSFINARRKNNEFPVESDPTKVLESIHHFCSCVLRIMPDTANDCLGDLIVKCMGASCMCDSTMELMNKFKMLNDQLAEVRSRQTKKQEKQFRQRRQGFNAEDEAEFDAETPPNDYRDIEVIPTIEELRCRAEEVFLRPNKKSGAYQSTNHYLDVQFRLLREDFVQPLRKGLATFVKDKTAYLEQDKRMPLGEVRLYKGVTFVRVEKERDSIVHKLQLCEKNYKKIKWDKSKRLLTGSLIVLTTEDLQTCFSDGNTHFGVVFSRNVKELSKGLVTVTWEGPPPVYEPDEQYVILESEVYLEAYRYTLETLKRLELDRFSMKKFIVDADSDVEAPAYLKTATEQLELKLANGEDIFLAPLDRNWPSAAEFGLDENQLKAYRAALTKEFAIIQGPPGTGKTFLGLKVAQTLLKNSSLWEDAGGNPITVVCYTNHALDQFMEGILRYYRQEDIPAEVIRIGGRCKSEELAKYTLREVRYRNRRRIPQHCYMEERNLRERIQELEDERYSKMNEVMGLQNVEGIVDFERLSVWSTIQPEYPKILWDHFQNPSWLGLGDDQMKRVVLPGNNIVPACFGIRVRESPKQERKDPKVTHAFRQDQVARNNFQDDDDLFDDEEYDIDELLDNRILEDILLEADTTVRKNVGRRLAYLMDCSLHNIEKKMRHIRRDQQEATRGLNMAETVKIREKNQGSLLILENRSKLLQELCQLHNAQRLDLPDGKELLGEIKSGGTVHYNKLRLAEKWAIYFALVEWARRNVAESVAAVESELSKEQKALREAMQYADGLILRGCKVVGLTTTGAAKYNNLLRMIRSKIVIVEEAAEVFESHIVTCITESCQQLILIGDHRQLRPSPTVYELAKRYHLDLSLFERMINNNLHCYSLKIQHRMRPDISDLVVGTIYEELIDHDHVKLYPDVMGVTKNVFFINHQEMESSETDSMSKSNVHEAKFIAGLCRYLVLQGYSPEDITVLTMYTGQMFLLKKQRHESCKDVRVTCVDNFQGEENKIILLSLVRSNKTGKIGFLSIDNRICVSLSRAKHGLFIIGNMDQMVGHETWRAIKQKLEIHDQIGTELEIQCQIHGERSRVKNGEDFMEKAPQGGCLQPCDVTLPCSHKCNQVCHVVDRNHMMYKCRLPCLKNCAKNQHPCKGKCSDQCPPCLVKVEKMLNCDYQHKQIMACYRNEEEVTCTEQVLKKLPCNHEQTLACHFKVEDYKCVEKVEKTLSCGHKRILECNVDPSSIRCKIVVDKLLPCEHKQQAECWLAVDNIKCVTLVPKKFPKCGHDTMVKCGERSKPAVCKGTCTTRLNCGHACVKLCHVEDDPDHLTYQCRKQCTRNCNDGHKCQVSHPCFHSCPPCKEKVTRDLPCGHSTELECHLDKDKYECLQPCERILPAPLCRHKCPNLCYQECGPCDKMVTKRAPCGHGQEVLCSSQPMKEHCEVLVPPRTLPVCGHRDSKVPCKYDSLSPEEVSKYCQYPCDHTFKPASGDGCQHNCLGSCSQCLQGRIHQKCGAQCGKQLVCGHVCEVPCSALCPPCKKPCMMKCEHTECKKKCGEPCSECKEKCTWNCEHLRCSKLCGEACDREPCNEPCKKKLKCGHDCVGYCGESCPPLCRICNKEELTDPFFGTEDEEDARFVYLTDCGHTIEAGGLEKWIRQNSNEISSKKCPMCKTTIRENRRFGNLVKQHYQDIIKVKMRTFGNKANSERMRDEWIGKLEDSSPVGRIFPQIKFRIRHFLVKETERSVGGRTAIHILRNDIDEFSMKSLNFIAQSVHKIASDILDLRREDKLVTPHYETVVSGFRKTLEYMLDRQPLSRQEISDFNEELDRLDYFKQLMMRRCFRTFNTGNSRAFEVFNEAKAIVESIRPFTEERRNLFKKLLENLDELLKTGLGITDRERQQILQAMGMGQGHWYKCPNGHIYVITECGGAMQESRCNECGAAIGGGSHRLRSDNQLASEMDGARAPAWPGAIH